jgi:16S rRNA (cytosine967-C5)-methyltransferase
MDCGGRAGTRPVGMTTLTAEPIRGLEVRRLAVKILAAVLEKQESVDDAFETEDALGLLAARDRGFLLILVLTALRRRGEINAVLARYLAKPLPRKSGATYAILTLAVAQLLFLDTPAHAAIDLAVQSARLDRNAMHFTGLINAILRKVSTEGKQALDGLDSAVLNTPDWLLARWVKRYGSPVARAIAMANSSEPAIDVVTRGDAAAWADRLSGVLLPSGHIRLPTGMGAIGELPGFAEGAWWVQDAAAGIPARLFGDLHGKTALDLCAAPGGKTLQLCAAGGRVTAVDSSATRAERLQDNLRRLKFSADIITEDVLDLSTADLFDAVLLDAPCSSTGTIRRHPELPYLKSEAQIASLAVLQRKMLLSAALRVRPGGMLVYCTCSLEPEEGEEQISRFLSHNTDFSLVPVVASNHGLPEASVAEAGWLRILPQMSIGGMQGLDGFFAAAMRRRCSE